MPSAARVFRRGQRIHLRLRGLVLTVWIRSQGGRVGRGLVVDRRVRLRRPPTSRWDLGRDVYIGVGAVIDIGQGAELTIGDRSKIMHYVVLAAATSVRLGCDTQVAEFTSIRDEDHDTTLGAVMARAQVRSTPVEIGDDVWIGRGVAVLRGARIEDHAVVAANAVVRGTVPANSVVGGVPARHLKSRE